MGSQFVLQLLACMLLLAVHHTDANAETEAEAGAGPLRGSSSLWCPLYHNITGHYDPSGPILVDGVWHVFPDGNGKGGGKGWSHFTSRDLLRWTEQNHSVVAGGDTGSISKTESGIIALYPDGTPRTLQRQVPTNEASGKLSLNVEWSAPVTAAKKPTSLGVGMRDPARALKMADGNWYVGAGSGFGGSGPKSNSKTGLPNSGTGCLAWFKATNSTLQEFEYVGCLLENNHTTGFIDPRTVAWNQTDRVAAFFECPDIFPLGSTGKYVAMASLYNWAAGGYYTNEWFLGTIDDSKTFKLEDRGLLDYGQYYAARTGSENQSPTGRRVLFSATGWHNPPGMASCHTQLHLIPRDVELDAKGRITFNPIPEIASTLRVPGSHVSLSTNSQPGQASTSATLTAAKGSSLELHLNCTGMATSGRAGLRILGTPDGKKYTEVAYDYATKRLVVDHTMSAGPAPPPSPPPVAPKCTGAKKPCPSAPQLLNIPDVGADRGSQCEWCVTNPDKSQCSKYCPSEQAHGAIVQTAPLAGGAESDGYEIEIIALVDRGLVESFLNRRAVISSFITELMEETTPSPEERTVAVSAAPPGVSCKFESYALQELNNGW